MGNKKEGIFLSLERKWNLEFVFDFGVGLRTFLPSRSKKRDFWLRKILSEEKRKEELDLESFCPGEQKGEKELDLE